MLDLIAPQIGKNSIGAHYSKKSDLIKTHFCGPKKSETLYRRKKVFAKKYIQFVSKKRDLINTHFPNSKKETLKTRNPPGPYTHPLVGPYNHPLYFIKIISSRALFRGIFCLLLKKIKIWHISWRLLNAYLEKLNQFVIFL